MLHISILNTIPLISIYDGQSWFESHSLIFCSYLETFYAGLYQGVLGFNEAHQSTCFRSHKIFQPTSTWRQCTATRPSSEVRRAHIRTSSAEDAQQWLSEIFGWIRKMKPLLVIIFIIKIFARTKLFNFSLQFKHCCHDRCCCSGVCWYHDRFFF